jgi:opine dehydrogenase
MEVAVLGAGGIGLGMTAFVAEAGHQPRLWSPSGAGTASFRTGAKLVASGLVTASFTPKVAQSAADAVAGAEAAIIAVPGNGHRTVIDAIVPHLSGGQTVIISSHCSLSALYLSQRLAARGVASPIAAWATTVVAGRRTGDAVNVGTLRKELDVATVPASATAAGLAVCRALFGERFRARDDLLAISLSNLNPPVHMANALCNLTRMERGEAWANYDCMTDAVGRLIEALDRERLSLAAAFGLTVRSIQDHMHLSFDLPRGSVGEMARIVHARRGGPPGPTSLEHRYVTEDVPFGLVPLVAIARAAGVATPLHDAGIALFSALYGRDFARENDLLPALGIADLPAPQLHALARDGYKPGAQ